ncbi:hypothetical protein HW115_18845 [Verrucomicrobiaceae bacterium N1E253]|uniref:Uncharacterized protein n=1 Tax=Oceaniferula marina TaxID=2748318 RepID=A0A851GJI8_9BACT|nr:hypothetical protein [Oceaniferula marina]NWK57683.1 hypothetical protein [Oceaniferula marina]
MKKELIIIAILQMACSISWFVHMSYLRSDYGNIRFRLGQDLGELEAYSKLRDQGVVLPDGIREHPNKDLMIDLGTGIHELTYMMPAAFVQVCIILALFILAFSKPSSNLGTNQAEQVAAPDS